MIYRQSFFFNLVRFALNVKKRAMHYILNLIEVKKKLDLVQFKLNMYKSKFLGSHYIYIYIYIYRYYMQLASYLELFFKYNLEISSICSEVTTFTIIRFFHQIFDLL